MLRQKLHPDPAVAGAAALHLHDSPFVALPLGSLLVIPNQRDPSSIQLKFCDLKQVSCRASCVTVNWYLQYFFFVRSDDVYKEIMKWQIHLHSKSSNEVQQFLNSNLNQIAKVKDFIKFTRVCWLNLMFLGETVFGGIDITYHVWGRRQTTKTTPPHVELWYFRS